MCRGSWTRNPGSCSLRSTQEFIKPGTGNTKTLGCLSLQDVWFTTDRYISMVTTISKSGYGRSRFFARCIPWASNTTAGRHPVLNSLGFRTNFEVISLVAPLGYSLVLDDRVLEGRSPFQDKKRSPMVQCGVWDQIQLVIRVIEGCEW